MSFWGNELIPLALIWRCTPKLEVTWSRSCSTSDSGGFPLYLKAVHELWCQRFPPPLKLWVILKFCSLIYTACCFRHRQRTNCIHLLGLWPPVVYPNDTAGGAVHVTLFWHLIWAWPRVAAFLLDSGVKALWACTKMPQVGYCGTSDPRCMVGHVTLQQWYNVQLDSDCLTV